MKIRLISFLILSIGFFSAANAQYANEIPISEIDADYIKVWSDSGPLFSSKITVRIDWGQGGRTPQITDERRRAVSFNGMMAALNVLSKEGFELVEIVRDSNDENEFFYLKRKNNTYSDNDNR